MFQNYILNMFTWD